MKGYKGMNADMTCRGMKYEVGKTYHVDGEEVEMWSPIPSFLKYEASNMGRIRRDQRILRQQVNRYGYKQVHITDNYGKRRYPYVHRLVAEAFLGQSNLTVNHRNEKKGDNRLSNLEYMTRDENWEYSGFARKCRIVKIDALDGKPLDVYQSIRDASRICGVSRSRIQLCLKGQAKTASGFSWMRLNNPMSRNSKGIGGIAKAENKNEYTLDAIGDVVIRLNKVLFEIPCEW